MALPGFTSILYGLDASALREMIRSADSPCRRYAGPRTTSSAAAAVTTASAAFFDSLAGYVLAKLEFPFKNVVFVAILAAVAGLGRLLGQLSNVLPVQGRHRIPTCFDGYAVRF